MRRMQKTIACPPRKARRPRTVIGTIGLIAPPSATAGISRTKTRRARAAAPQDSSSSAPPASTTASAPVNLVPPKPSTNARKSIADARAELTSLPMRDEQDTSVSVDPRVNAAGVQNSQRAATTEAAAPASPITFALARYRGREPLQRSPRRRCRSAGKSAGERRDDVTAGRYPGSARRSGPVSGKAVGIDADAVPRDGRRAHAGGPDG